jgi:hypothetical protein
VLFGLSGRLYIDIPSLAELELLIFGLVSRRVMIKGSSALYTSHLSMYATPPAPARQLQ